MRMILLTAGLLALFSSVSRGQGNAQLELSRELLELERYTDAAQVAEQAYHSGQQAKDLTVQTEAKLLQAEAFFGKQTANSLNWRQKIKVKRALKSAERLLEKAPNDQLQLRYQQLARRLNNKPQSPIQPGGVAQKRPTLEQLKQRKLDVMRAVGDSILSLKKEREAFEKEVQTLTDEQARQELLLARGRRLQKLDQLRHLLGDERFGGNSLGGTFGFVLAVGF